MPYASPQRRSRETNLQVLREVKADLLQVVERALRKLMPGKLAEENLAANLSQPVQKPGQHQRRGAREIQRVHGIRIVTQHERSGLRWSQPLTLLAERHRI